MFAPDLGATGLDAPALDAEEQALVDRVAARRDELADLACRLIAFDTTSRSRPEDPPRGEAALQMAATSGTRSVTGLALEDRRSAMHDRSPST